MQCDGPGAVRRSDSGVRGHPGSALWRRPGSDVFLFWAGGAVTWPGLLHTGWTAGERTTHKGRALWVGVVSRWGMTPGVSCLLGCAVSCGACGRGRGVRGPSGDRHWASADWSPAPLTPGSGRQEVDPGPLWRSPINQIECTWNLLKMDVCLSLCLGSQVVVYGETHSDSPVELCSEDSSWFFSSSERFSCVSWSTPLWLHCQGQTLSVHLCLSLSVCLSVMVLTLSLPQGSLSVSQLQQVEKCVNDIVSANQIVYSQELPLQTARSIRGLRTVDEVNVSPSSDLVRLSVGALTVCNFLSQVYPDPVRVVAVAVPVSELLDNGTDRQTSVELCCGTWDWNTLITCTQQRTGNLFWKLWNIDRKCEPVPLLPVSVQSPA